MALQKLTEEQLEKMSMIELANLILADQKKELNFKELFDKVAALKKFSDSQRSDLLARFYTDLNVDGRFTTLGSNLWGLKRWYPIDQTSEKSLAESRKRDLEEEDLDEELVEEELEDDLEEDAEESDNDIYGDYEELGFEKVEEE